MADLPDPRRHAPATGRNRGPILAVLKDVLPRSGLLLEVASGSGEHAAFIAPRLWSTLTWQPSDADPSALPGIDAHARASGAATIAPAILLDAASDAWPLDQARAIFAANLVHIAPWPVAQGLMRGAGRLLQTGGQLILYGPFKRHGAHTAPSNEAFDRSLRAQNPAWGVRCLDTELEPLATAAGLVRRRVVQMPANNLVVVWQKA
jgi:SAM-dependent methyltransferase